MPGLRETTTPARFRSLNVAGALEDGWQHSGSGRSTLSPRRPTATKSTLRLCLWSPTTSLVERGAGKPVGADEVDHLWARQIATVTKSGNRWRLSDLKYDARVCKGIPRP